MFLFGLVRRAVLGEDVHSWSVGSRDTASPSGGHGRGTVEWLTGGEEPTLCLRAVAMAPRAVAPARGICGLCLGPVATAALVCFDVTMC